MKKKTPDVGEAAPDFKALTFENKDFKLSTALKAGKNMLVFFYRGHW